MQNPFKGCISTESLVSTDLVVDLCQQRTKLHKSRLMILNITLNQWVSNLRLYFLLLFLFILFAEENMKENTLTLKPKANVILNVS